MEWFWNWRGQYSVLPQCQPNTCHESIHQWEKWVRHLLGKAWLNWEGSGGFLVFWPSTGWNTSEGLLGIVVVKLTVEPGHFVPCWKEQKKQSKSKVLRDHCPKRRKMEQPLTEKKRKIFSMVKNDTHKIRGLHRIWKKPDTKINAGSVSAQGKKTGAAAETVQEWENSTWKNCATRKRKCYKKNWVLWQLWPTSNRKKEKL